MAASLAFEDVDVIIQSKSHPYSVETFEDLASTLAATSLPERSHWLVDQVLLHLHPAAFRGRLPELRTVLIEATEERKSYEAIGPVFLDLLGKGLKRDGNLVVVGGGVVQDIGCFIATVLARGIRWELVPTTLLAQADSCRIKLAPSTHRIEFSSVPRHSDRCPGTRCGRELARSSSSSS
jgi:3-dehydroquinate synthase